MVIDLQPHATEFFYRVSKKPPNYPKELDTLTLRYIATHRDSSAFFSMPLMQVNQAMKFSDPMIIRSNLAGTKEFNDEKYP